MQTNLALLRDLPKIDEALTLAASRPEMEGTARAVLLEAVREVVEGLRRGMLAGTLKSIPDDNELALLMEEAVKARSGYNLRPVINATGVVLHTNLGRAPLAESVMEHVKKVASGFCSLEYDMAGCSRGSRDLHVENLLRGLTGCEAAVTVNNNAAAVLLILSTLCKDREVIVSRGELVEIGSSFRLPDIMAQSGAVLKEVGTTNKTRISDYQLAVTEKTGVLLKVHTSNFRMVGFAEQTSLEELKRLGNQHKIPLIYDLGSGLLLDGVIDEPTISEAIKSGADLVCFSGDKLLGGPQTGIIIGKKELIAAIKASPLTRAMRPDKLILAALEATLRLYLEPEKARREIPALAMLVEPEEELLERADSLSILLKKHENENFRITLEQTESEAGGGCAPGQKLLSWSVAVEPLEIDINELEQRLRRRETPIICRVHKGRLFLDMRSVGRESFSEIEAAFAELADA